MRKDRDRDDEPRAISRAPTFLDRIITSVAPGWGLRRARARWAVNAFYEAARPSRLHKDRRNDRGDANTQTERAAPQLRSMARYQDENFDIAKGVLNTLVNKTIGSGIRPEPQVKNIDGSPATDVNAALRKYFRDWSKLPEVTWSLGYFNSQRLMARTLYRDGELFGQLIQGTAQALDHGTMVPFSIEFLESDFVPHEYSVNDPNNLVIQGVQLNTWGQPIGYYVFKIHPGSSRVVVTAAQLKTIPAKSMMHLRLVERWGQVRGVSIFASVLDRFDDIKEIDESERVAARVAAAMAAYIKKGGPDSFNPPDPNSATSKFRAMEFVPGMIFDDLLPGEEIGTIVSNRPNSGLPAFRKDQLRAVAAGTGTGISSISKDYAGTYSSQRQELVEGKTDYDALTDYFIDVAAQPIWERFVDTAIAARLVKLSAKVDKDTLHDASHSRPALPWIDPLKEVEAAALAEDRGYTSRSRVIRGRGEDPDTINQELVHDQEEEKRLGLEIPRPATTGAGATPPPEDDPQTPPPLPAPAT